MLGGPATLHGLTVFVKSTRQITELVGPLKTGYVSIAFTYPKLTQPRSHDRYRQYQSLSQPDRHAEYDRNDPESAEKHRYR